MVEAWPVHYVYTLSDPNTGDVRYVGATGNPSKRLAKHLRDRASSPGVNPDKVAWIDALRVRGQKPEMRVIACVLAHTAFLAEMFWIVYYSEQGAPLLNRDRIKQGRSAREMRDHWEQHTDSVCAVLNG